jgi:hypothetical protein
MQIVCWEYVFIRSFINNENQVSHKLKSETIHIIWRKLIVGLVGRSVVGGLVVVSLGVTIVGDISDVTGITVDVIVDGLAATIGKNDGVRSLGVVTIASLVVAHIDVGVVVLDGVVEAVVGGGLAIKIDNI